MAKAVVYLLLAAAFVALVIFGPPSNHHSGSHRRLGNHSPTFDPLVAKMERMAESSSSFAHDVVEEKEHFSEGKLNITLRLVILFPLLDREPKDGVVSSSELIAWITEQAVERLNFRTWKELTSRDMDKDGALSFKEYLPQFSDEDLEKNGMEHGEAGWWKEQFVNADIDHDGLLKFDELKGFLHPEDSHNEEIRKWLLREKIKRMDNDNDGKLNFVEFRDHAYDIYKNYVDYETAGVHVPSSEDKFAELDLNKDKLLTVEELRPILSYLHPGEISYAKYYANYLIHEADDNKDQKLTLDEMLNHEYIFYSTVYDDNHEDYDEVFRDEL
ncbi:hypothetical protein UlMin_045489 [Ulmus minor]